MRSSPQGEPLEEGGYVMNQYYKACQTRNQGFLAPSEVHAPKTARRADSPQPQGLQAEISDARALNLYREDFRLQGDS